MVDSMPPAGSPGPPPGPAPTTRSSATGWIIAFVVVVVLLAIAVTYILVSDDDGDDATTQGSPSTTTTATETEAASEAENGSDEPTDEDEGSVSVDCSADAILAAVDPDVAPADQGVSDYACTEGSAGAGSYAWAKLVAPGVDPVDAFFVAVVDEGTGEAGWQMLDYGTAVFCEDSMPAEACDQLAGAPRA